MKLKKVARVACFCCAEQCFLLRPFGEGSHVQGFAYWSNSERNTHVIVILTIESIKNLSNIAVKSKRRTARSHVREESSFVALSALFGGDPGRTEVTFGARCSCTRYVLPRVGQPQM